MDAAKVQRSKSFVALTTNPPMREIISATDPAEARAKILALEASMRPLPQIDCPLKHHFAPGSYAREIFLPAGSLVVGKIHKHAHVNVISQGHCTVYTDTGTRELRAPVTFVSEPGTKRVVLAHADTVWTTVHVTNETDLTKIEDEVIATSYDELAQLEQVKTMLLEVEADT
jgi:quercetin dioxygenase-like cupin family protein